MDLKASVSSSTRSLEANVQSVNFRSSEEELENDDGVQNAVVQIDPDSSQAYLAVTGQGCAMVEVTPHRNNNKSHERKPMRFRAWCNYFVMIPSFLHVAAL